MDEAKAAPPKIKVVDRRKFTVDGEQREDPITSEDEPSVDESTLDDRPPHSAVSDGPVPEIPPPPVADSPPEVAARSESLPEFIELVLMLAQQAELLLVGGEGFPAQPAEAKRTIDYLGVLESKTRGNLSPEEEKTLSNIVFQLRTAYLQRK